MRSLISNAGVAAVVAACAVHGGQGNTAAITFTGTVVNLCVLTITTPGLLGMSSTGTQLGSQNIGGVAATMTVTSSGTAPTISFTAPVLSGPSASTADATTMLQYASTGGASQAYSSSGYTYTMTNLLDMVTVNAQANNASGFVSGVYTINSTATCQQ